MHYVYDVSNWSILLVMNNSRVGIVKQSSNSLKYPTKIRVIAVMSPFSSSPTSCSLSFPSLLPFMLLFLLFRI